MQFFNRVLNTNGLILEFKLEPARVSQTTVEPMVVLSVCGSDCWTETTAVMESSHQSISGAELDFRCPVVDIGVCAYPQQNDWFFRHPQKDLFISLIP